MPCVCWAVESDCSNGALVIYLWQSKRIYIFSLISKIDSSFEIQCDVFEIILRIPAVRDPFWLYKICSLQNIKTNEANFFFVKIIFRDSRPEKNYFKPIFILVRWVWQSCNSESNFLIKLNIKPSYNLVNLMRLSNIIL